MIRLDDGRSERAVSVQDRDGFAGTRPEDAEEVGFLPRIEAK